MPEQTYSVHTNPDLPILLGNCEALVAKVQVTWFEDQRAMRMKSNTCSLCDLADQAFVTKANSKANLPHIKLGRFGRTTKKSPSGRSFRCNDNHEAITGIEGDYDDGEINPADAAKRLAEAGVAALIVTSPSHGVEGKGHRWRVLCPCRKECRPDRRAILVARVNGVLNGVLARESFTASQSYTFGTLADRGNPEIYLAEGRFIDECEDLDEIAIGSGRRSEIESSTSTAAVDQADNPSAVVAAHQLLEKAVDRVENAESPRNDVLNQHAYRLGGLLACSLLSEREIVESLVGAAEVCGYIADYGESETIRVIKSALQAGARKPTPIDAAGCANAIDLSKYSANQDGAIRAFTDCYCDILRYDHDRRTWYHYDGNTWQPERTSLAKDLSRQTCMALSKQSGTRGLSHKGSWDSVESGAQADRAFATVSTNWDCDPWLVGTPEGVVDLRTGELRSGSPKDMISKRTAVHPLPLDDFDAQRDCPNWMNFLYFALDGDEDAIRFLSQWAGMSLTGDTSEQKLLFVHGGGGNGKGVAINTLARVSGDYAADVPTRTLTAQRYDAHPTELARLQGVRLAHASEVDRGAKWADARIKSLTGGDPVTARFMRADDFTFYPQLTLTVVGNDRPSFGKLDDAMRRRFLLLEMDRRPKKPDPTLPEKLWKEAPGILTWMIRGALDWRENGLLIPSSVRRATDEYFAEQDHFGRFLEDCCSFEPSGRAATRDLQERYSTWQVNRNEGPGMSEREIAQEMKRRGYLAVPKVKRLDGGRGNGFKGICITDME